MCRRPRAAGFTVLEVMAAVVILAMFGTILLQQFSQGAGYEGEAARRLRASFLADRALWQIEAGLKLGAPPQPKQERTETEDGFVVSVEVQPLELAQLGLAPPAEASVEATSQGETPNAATPPLPLFTVLVRVGWMEGLTEQSVTRTTFAFDGTAVAQALGAEQQQQGQQEQPEAPAPEEIQ
jgi:type II secretory pathway component PulJ